MPNPTLIPILLSALVLAGLVGGALWYGTLIRRRRQLQPILRRLHDLQATLAPWPTRSRAPLR